MEQKETYMLQFLSEEALEHRVYNKKLGWEKQLL